MGEQPTSVDSVRRRLGQRRARQRGRAVVRQQSAHRRRRRARELRRDAVRGARLRPTPRRGRHDRDVARAHRHLAVGVPRDPERLRERPDDRPLRQRARTQARGGSVREQSIRPRSRRELQAKLRRNDHQHRPDRRGLRRSASSRSSPGSRSRSPTSCSSPAPTRRGWPSSRKRAVRTSTPTWSAATAGRRSRPSPLAEGVFVGAPFSAQDPRPEVQAFVTAYSKKFNSIPDGNAALAYDATKLLAHAVEQVGPDRVKIRDYLANLSENIAFHGVTGSDPFQRRRRSHRQEHRHDARARRRHAGGGGQVRLLELTQFNSIRGRLWIGFGVLVAILLARGLRGAERSHRDVGRRSSRRSRRSKRKRQLTSQVSADVAKTIEAASRYLDTRDSSAQSAFRAFGWAAHDVQRQMNEPSEPVGVGSRGRRDDRRQAVGDGDPLRTRASSGRPRPRRRRAASRRATRGARSTICSADIDAARPHQGREGRCGAVRSRGGDRRGGRMCCSPSSGSPSSSASSS